jgi:hypothetical protein
MQQQNGMMKMNYNSYQQGYAGGMINQQQNFTMMQQAYNGIPGQPTTYYPGQVPYQQQFNGGDSSRKHRNRSSCN